MSDFPGLYLPEIHHLVLEQEQRIPQKINFDRQLDASIGRLRSGVDKADGGGHPEWTRVWKKRSPLDTYKTRFQEWKHVDFLPGGDIIAVLDNKLHVYDEDGQSKPVPFPVDNGTLYYKVIVHRPSSAVVVITGISKIILFTPEKTEKSNEFVKSEQMHKFEESDIPKQTDGRTWRTTEMEYRGTCAAFTPEGDLIVPGYETLMKYSISGDLVWKVGLDNICVDLTITPDGTIITCPYSDDTNIEIFNSHGKKLRDVPQPARTRLRKIFNYFKSDYEPPVDNQNVFTNSKGDVYFWFDVLSDLLVLNMEGGFEKGPKLLSRWDKCERIITGMGGVFTSIDNNRMIVGSGRDLMLYQYNAKTKPSAHARISSTQGIIAPLQLGMNILYMYTLINDAPFYDGMKHAVMSFVHFVLVIIIMVVFLPILILPIMVFLICGYIYLLNIL